MCCSESNPAGRASGGWRAPIAAALLCLWSSLACAAGLLGTDPNLPLAGLRLAGNGDLVGWKVDGLGAHAAELIEPGKALIEFHLLAGGRDVRDQIAWHRADPVSGRLAEFTGRLANPALEIRLQYEPGARPGTFVLQVELVHEGGAPARDVRAIVHVLPALNRHTARDGSLGDYFYGYSRAFAASGPGGAFEPVREQGAAAAVALAVRHVAVAAVPAFVGNDGLVVHPESGATYSLDSGVQAGRHRLELGAVELRAGTTAGGRYANLMYPEMWGPLRALARLLEMALQALADTLHSAAAAIVLLALSLRVVLLPVNLWSVRQQRNFTAVQRRMKPAIAHINATMKGDDRGEAILETWKSHGVSPFSGLKGSVGLLFQVPILIALFAVTTESALFRDAAFLWARDLSLPDRAFALPISIPGLGSYLNGLPLCLGVACVFAAVAQARWTGPGETASLRSGLILALAFVVLFYSCAAALVLYWTVVILSQIAEGWTVARM